MGVLATVASVIIEGTTAVYGLASTAVTLTEIAITEVISNAMLVGVSDATVIQSEILASTTLITSETMAIGVELESIVQQAATAVYLNTTANIKTLNAAYTSFLETIHYETLLKVHEIAYIVSEDYRAQVNQVYGRIAEVSEALGLGAQFINLALRNARAITLDVNAAIGKYYDVGEVTWMKNLADFLGSWNDEFSTDVMKETGRYEVESYDEKIKADRRAQDLNLEHPQHKAEVYNDAGKWKVKYQVLEQSGIAVTVKYAQKYKNNPGEIFYDIDTRLIKPHVDESASTSQVMFSTVDAIVKVTDSVVSDVQTINNDLGKLVQELPSSVRKEIGPYIEKVTGKIDNWIDTTYKPKSVLIDRTLDVLVADKKAHTERVNKLYDRLRRPGQYIREIELLPESHRHEDEAVINDMANRTPNRLASDSKATRSKATDSLSKIGKTLEYKVEPLPLLELEPITVSKEEVQEAKERKTWFVGDY